MEEIHGNQWKWKSMGNQWETNWLRPPTRLINHHLKSQSHVFQRGRSTTKQEEIHWKSTEEVLWSDLQWSEVMWSGVKWCSMLMIFLERDFDAWIVSMELEKPGDSISTLVGWDTCLDCGDFNLHRVISMVANMERTSLHMLGYDGFYYGYINPLNTKPFSWIWMNDNWSPHVVMSLEWPLEFWKSSP